METMREKYEKLVTDQLKICCGTMLRLNELGFLNEKNVEYHYGMLEAVAFMGLRMELVKYSEYEGLTETINMIYKEARGLIRDEEGK